MRILRSRSLEGRKGQARLVLLILIFISIIGLAALAASVTVSNVATYSPQTATNITTEAYPLSHITLNDSSLGLYMPFDVNFTNPANTTYDYSQYNKDGTAVNGTIYNTSGYIGGAASFEGTGGSGKNQTIELPRCVICYNNTFTISAWVWSADKVNTVRTIYSERGTGAMTPGIRLMLAANGGIFYAIQNGTSGGSGQLQNTTALKDLNNSQWHHVVWVRAGNTDTKIYVDGANIHNDTRILTNLTMNLNARIGTNAVSNGNFNGTLDEIMVWNRSLSASEVTLLYTSQYGRYATAPRTQVFNNISLGQDGTINSVNVTTNTTQLNGTSIQLQLWYYNSTGANTGNSSWSTVTSGTNQVTTFMNIPITTYNVSLSFNFTSNAFSGYSPILHDSINITSWPQTPGVTYFSIATYAPQTATNITTEPYPLSHITLNDSYLIGYYPFDVDFTATPNNVTYDYSANNNDGNGKGGTSLNSSGYIGSAASFRRDSQFIDLNKCLICENTTFSISAWFWTSHQETGNLDIYSEGNTTSTTIRKLFEVSFSTGAIFIQLQNSTTTVSNNTIAFIKNLNDSQWHHAVWVSNSTGQFIFVDGTLYINDSRTTPTNIILDTANIGVMETSAGYQRYFNGTIDELMIWNRSLSVDEVTALYSSQYGRYASAPRTQVFSGINFTQDGFASMVNIITNSTNLNGSSLQMRIWEYTGTANTQNSSWSSINGTNNVARFPILAATDNLSIEINFTPGNGNFYSPILSGYINVTAGGLTGCTNLSEANRYYILAQNIASNGTCFNVTADNITLDGFGFTLTGNTIGSGISNVNGGDNITVKNFAGINNFTTAIDFENTVNNTIVNNTVNFSMTFASGYIIVFTDVNNSNISNNQFQINVSDTLQPSIYFTASSNNIVSKNNISTKDSVAPSLSQGFYSTDSSNNNISGNNFTIVGNTSRGVGLDGGTNNTVSYNTINATALLNNTWGYDIYAGTSPNFTVIFNNVSYINGSWCSGIYISGSNGISNITGNDVTTRGYGALGIYLEYSNNSIISSNNVTTFGESSPPIYFAQAYNNNISQNMLTFISIGSTSSQGILFWSTAGSNDNNIISDNIINIFGGTGVGIQIQPGSSNTIKFNNITTNGTDSAWGISVADSRSHHNNISSNNVTTYGSSSYGIYLYSSTYSNNISFNNIVTTGTNSYGLNLWSSVTSNNFSFNNVTTTGSSAAGIWVTSSSSSNTFLSNNVTTTGSSAYGVYSASNSNSFLSNIFSVNGTSAYGLYIVASSNTFTKDRVTSNNSYELYDDGTGGDNSLTNVIFSGVVNLTSVGFKGVAIEVNGTKYTDPSNKRNLSYYLNVTNTTTASWIDFNMSYADSDVSGLFESTVLVYQYNASSTWQSVSTSTVDEANNIVASGNVTINGNATFTAMGMINDTVLPQVSFAYPTPDNSSAKSANYIYVNVTSSDANNHSVILDWNRSLVGWWRFNNESGENATTFRDWSSYGNNGNCSETTCPNYTYDGVFGGAMNFDGVDDYVEVPDNTILEPLGDMSISLWVRFVQLPSARSQNAFLVGKKNTIAPYSSYDVYVDKTNNKLNLDWMNASGENFWAVGNTPLIANKWYFVVAIKTGSALKLYLNGADDTGSAYNPIGPIFDSNSSLTIGSDIYTVFTNGSIDDVQIYGRALSSEEINASYSAGAYRYEHNFTGLPDGNYNFTAYAQDISGNVNSTGLRTVDVETTIPQVSFVSPTPANNTIQANDSIYVNVTSSHVSNYTGNYSVILDWNRSLVGWWRFNNESGENGTFFRDWSSWSNNGSCSGTYCPNFTSAGKLGGAMIFNDSKGIDIPDSSSLDGMSAITIAFWIKVAPENANGATIFDKRHSVSPFNSYRALIDNPGSGGRISFTLTNDTSDSGLCVTPTDSLVFDEWNYVTAVYNGSHINVYWNSLLSPLCTDVAFIGSVLNSDGILYLDGWAPRSAMTLDDFRIYNRALLPEEINASYSAGAYRYEHNFTNLPAGTYDFTAYAQDAAGNVAKTGQYSVTVPVFVDSCMNFTSAGLTYTQIANIVPVNDAMPCINVTVDNITFDGNGFSIVNYTFNNSAIWVNHRGAIIMNVNLSIGNDTMYTNGIGLYASGNNISILNSTFSYNYDGAHLYLTGGNVTNITANYNKNEGLYVSDTTFVTFNNITTNNNYYGFYIIASSGNYINNVTANGNVHGIYGGYAENSNVFSNISASSNSLDGFMIGGSNNNVSDMVLNNNGQSIYIGSAVDANNNTIANCIVNGSTYNAIYFALNAQNNTFRNITISNTTLNDTLFDNEGQNSTHFVDMNIGKYRFTGYGGTIIYKKTGKAEITFLSPINGSGESLSGELDVGSTYAWVNGSNAGLNILSFGNFAECNFIQGRICLPCKHLHESDTFEFHNSDLQRDQLVELHACEQLRQS
jgi:Concanavalin A-like lectin/glucanases superfamily